LSPASSRSKAAVPGNSASAHAAGRRARAELEAARDRIAAALGVASADVVFTSGGTEAAGLAVLGLGDPALPAPLAATEHAAVHEPATARGVQPWAVDAEGRAVVQRPTYRSASSASCTPRASWAPCNRSPTRWRWRGNSACRAWWTQHRPWVGLPLAGAVASGAVVALSPHKAGGLRGHGVLAGADLSARLRPLLRGGGQELGRWPGTQSPALAAANALAIERAVAEQPARAAAMAAAATPSSPVSPRPALPTGC
jgi:cysteine desulfurase